MSADEQELTPANVAEALGLRPKQEAPDEPPVKAETDASPVGETPDDHVDEQHERDAEAGPVADTEQQQENEWLANHQRELRRMQEANPENAAELAVLFGNPEQRQREHDWLARMHQPRPEDTA